ncbi:F-box protein CPR1-like [Cornus florida]|uniref:F-box protein CPR1-like n=1 Tax=Cornus florida TaxID=4283 RepID=UPI00289F23F4|nr:F-box protein CPR1-like [Cornus florida]
MGFDFNFYKITVKSLVSRYSSIVRSKLSGPSYAAQVIPRFRNKKLGFFYHYQFCSCESIEIMGRGKRRASSRSNLFHLPEDILIQILVKLPAKSLLRFRSICKSWCSLISHPSFIDAHLKHQTSSSNNNNSYLLLRYKPDIHNKKSKALYSIHHDDESFRQYFQPELPEQFKSSDIYGTCNGIVCLSESPLIPSSDIYLWNPALRRMKTLPTPHKVDLLGTAFVAFGLDCCGNDYIVMKIVSFPPDINNPFNTSFRLDVYSLSTNSWRKIGVAALSCSIRGCQLAINNGAAYWTAYVETKDAEGWTIFQIEMGDKVCSEVMLPDDAQRGCPSMAVWGESLYLYDFLWNKG